MSISSGPMVGLDNDIKQAMQNPPNNNGNGAATPGAASAAPTNVVKFPEVTTSEGQSALAKVLGGALAGQFEADETPPGQPAPAGPKPGAPGAAPGQPENPEAPAGQPANPENPEAAPALEAAPAAEPAPAETPPAAGLLTPAEVEEIVTTRGRKLTEEVNRLKTELDSRPTVTLGNDPLAHVTNLNKLASLHEQTEAAAERDDLLLRQLAYAPKKVEAALRAEAETTPEFKKYFTREVDGETVEDYDPGKMGELLAARLQDNRALLAAVPNRRKYLEELPKAERLAQNAHPWLAKADDPRTVVFTQLENSPLGQLAKSQAPGWRYWMACAAAMHVAITEAVKVRGNGAPAATRAPAPLPGTGGPVEAAPAAAPGKGRAVANYKANLKAGMAADKALARFYEETGLAVASR